MIRRSLLAVAFLCIGGLAQSPAFDVASVKPNPARTDRRYRISPQRLDLTGETLIYIISQAYQTPLPRIVRPAAMADLLRKEYDIRATTEHPATRDQILAMLQTLLRERFGMTVHHESRTGSIYNLVVAKNGPRIKKSETEFETGPPSMNLDSVEGRGVQLSQLCFLLTARLDRPVVDRTGLSGLYDFRLRLDTLQQRPDVDPKASGESWSFSSIFADIEAQLGLKLESARGPVNYLVIDKLNEPSED